MNMGSDRYDAKRGTQVRSQQNADGAKLSALVSDTVGSRVVLEGSVA